MDGRAFFALAGVLAFLGCRAVVVELRRAVKGPVAEVGYIDPGGGHVRYALRGAAFFVSQRRKDALKLAGRHCGGPKGGSKDGAVKIVKEWAQEDNETPYNAEDLEASLRYNLDHYRVEPYQHLLFECVRPP
ncbi:MAG: hypothetical protein HY922_06405 [Elusimicrobia bacterium]|nr:hypothetical protein [Elusimicrobiota bacterium]